MGQNGCPNGSDVSFMPGSVSAANELLAQSLESLVESCTHQALAVAGRRDAPRIVISPYRFNPLGAHIDHQGGAVLARCLDQYTVLCFWSRADEMCVVHSSLEKSEWQCASFNPDQLDNAYGWDSMARASTAAFAAEYDMQSGYEAVVFGTLVSGGLSSSASVILAYLTALAEVNQINLGATELVELVRRVENDYRGLNNGVQDQMSIVFGKQHHLAVLDVANVTAKTIADPDNVDEVTFLMCYSGVSRNLVTGSNFNVRVAECREAARLLARDAEHLGEVPKALRTDEAIAGLPIIAQRRAMHVFGEMQRVQQGCVAWESGNWAEFGGLMNQSCHSSINYYESGSPWLIDLHEMAGEIDGVYGSRFSGGGFGGCLFVLVDTSKKELVAQKLLSSYLNKYPELTSLARVSIAQSESTVRVFSS